MLVIPSNELMSASWITKITHSCNNGLSHWLISISGRHLYIFFSQGNIVNSYSIVSLVTHTYLHMIIGSDCINGSGVPSSATEHTLIGGRY